MREDVGEIKAILNPLAPLIDEFRGFMTATLPTLATKQEVTELRLELRLEIAQRPTRRQSVFDMFAIVGSIGAILGDCLSFRTLRPRYPCCDFWRPVGPGDS
jgi:hypothetical protein